MRRPLTLLLSLWLSLLSADLPALHACAMHGGQGHATTPMASVAVGHVHGAHAVAAAPLAAALEGDDVGEPGDDAADVCQCLGECCTASAAPLPRAGEQTFSVLVHVEIATRQRGARVRSRASDLVLPFPIGPPGPLTA